MCFFWNVLKLEENIKNNYYQLDGITQELNQNLQIYVTMSRKCKFRYTLLLLLLLTINLNNLFVFY